MQGQTLLIHLPSGKKFTIRENNGNDESILSNIGGTGTGDSINAFLSGIIIDSDKPSASDIGKWPCSDKYYLLFKQRIFNNGFELKFKHVDPQDDKKRVVEYVEDLSGVDGDLSDPSYKPNDTQVKPYPYGSAEYVESTFDERKFRFKIITGEMEEKQSQLPDSEKNINTILTARNLEEWVNGAWLRVTGFHNFPSKLMAKLRTWVSINDPLFAPMVTVINPFTKNPLSFPLMHLKDFFFPEGTI